MKIQMSLMVECTGGDIFYRDVPESELILPYASGQEVQCGSFDDDTTTKVASIERDLPEGSIIIDLEPLIYRPTGHPGFPSADEIVQSIEQNGFVRDRMQPTG